jgi:hypothetical protein
MEILGRLFMMTLLMRLASGAGLVCALIVFSVLRNFRISSRRATIVAALFPPAVTAYLLCFVIASSILSSFIGTPDLLFGDINEPLPNGFKLFALDKFVMFVIAFIPPIAIGLWLLWHLRNPHSHPKNKSGAVRLRIGSPRPDQR